MDYAALRYNQAFPAFPHCSAAPICRKQYTIRWANDRFTSNAAAKSPE